MTRIVGGAVMIAALSACADEKQIAGAAVDGGSADAAVTDSELSLGPIPFDPDASFFPGYLTGPPDGSFPTQPYDCALTPPAYSAEHLCFTVEGLKDGSYYSPRLLPGVTAEEPCPAMTSLLWVHNGYAEGVSCEDTPLCGPEAQIFDASPTLCCYWMFRRCGF
jgi:hypothetical protein